MIISKVKMVNFRGFRNKTIKFNDKTVILLSAANGIGKTTVIDAIEWCLTGEIGRLKTAFDSRSTNDTDRRKNKNGILKNRSANENENVEVHLWIIDGQKEILMCRKQQKDELNPDASKITIDDDENKAREFIEQRVGDSFYNFHFCDVQKSFSIQSAKRGDLESLFSEFITNYDAQKQIIENINLFADDVERYMDDNEKKKIPSELIKKYQEDLSRISKDHKQLLYPKTIFYSGESIEIENLNKENLSLQKSKIEQCGYTVAKNEMQKLIDNESLKNQIVLINRIQDFLVNKEEKIRKAFEAGLFGKTDVISSYTTTIERLKKLALIRATIEQDVEVIIKYDKRNSLQNFFHIIKKEIIEKEKRVTTLSSDIDLLVNNNKVLILLSTLSANKDVILEYRKNLLMKEDVAKCPVCGSATFGMMDEESILTVADDYIQQNDKRVKEKEYEKINLQKDIDSLYEKMIIKAKSVVEIKVKELKEKVNSLIKLNDELQPYLEDVRKLEMNWNEISIENIDKEGIEEIKNSIESKIFSESKERKAIKLYKNILTVLGYKFKDETLLQTYEKVKQLVSEPYDITNFSYEKFVSKINAIDSIISNNTIEDIQKKIEEGINTNRDIDAKNENLQKLKVLAIEKANKIKAVVDKLTQDEYQKIGPTLNKFYKKLLRIDSHGEINIVRDNDNGISLVDDRKKNIVNILSNGQISVFLLAYFFAGINVRNKREKIKIFFIDDLTACMDDVNMLAFIDLLKYQISLKKTIDQLFFVTCDSRISRLIKYKMNGRGIALKELSEIDFKQQ